MADSAEALSGFAFARAVLAGTPYARGSLQDLRNLRQVRIEDLRAFHRAHFTPRNSLLLIVGRVDRPTFRARIESLFGAWKGGKPVKSDVRFTDRRFVGKRGPEGDIFLVDRPDLPQAQVRIGFPVPGLHSKSRHALAVGNALLGEYFNSRLNLVVRDQMGLAYGIQSGITYLRDYAFLSVASATASANTGKLVEETLRQLRLARAGDVLAQEVETSKAYLIGGFPLGLSTLSAVASRWLAGYRFDMGPDYLNGFIPKVSAVTREKVVHALSEAFALDRMVIVVSGSAAEIEKSLREKGFKRIRRISAKALL
jgi:predicted Zn-dependent peptidase